MRFGFNRHVVALTAVISVVGAPVAIACTGISLEAQDGTTIVARTVEWALGDADHDTLVLFPRNYEFVGQTPEGYNGLTWTGEYGFVSLSAYGEPYGPDGMNEVGLYVGMYYFPDFASFEAYDSSQGDSSLSVGDFMRWMLSNFSTVEEVRENLDKVHVVNVDDPRFGGAALPFHWKIADPTGESIVIEITDGGKIEIFNTVEGVITNSPGYGWHLTNLRNYLGLSPVAEAPTVLDSQVFAPLGSGSGMRGLPGDFTPPSRFLRALAFTASARPLEKSQDAVFEAFRILDNFNIPVGSTGAPGEIATDIESATQITTVSDLDNKLFYFHTMSDRQVRMLDLNKIDFGSIEMQLITSGASTKQTIREVTPNEGSL